MFNLLADRVVGAKVLDVFSGSGSLGIEALSRGAGFCVFVERTASCVQSIRSNLERTHLSDCARILRADVFGVLRRLTPEDVFDLVLAAPPYRIVDELPSRQRLWQWLTKLVTGDALGSDAMLVLEHRRQKNALVFPDEIELLDSRTYGDTTLSLLSRRT